jgi:hypothetical protein
MKDRNQVGYFLFLLTETIGNRRKPKKSSNREEFKSSNREAFKSSNCEEFKSSNRGAFKWAPEEILDRMKAFSKNVCSGDLSCKGSTVENKNSGSITDLLSRLYSAIALEGKETMINIAWTLEMIRFKQRFDEELE